MRYNKFPIISFLCEWISCQKIYEILCQKYYGAEKRLLLLKLGIGIYNPRPCTKRLYNIVRIRRTMIAVKLVALHG